uniref:RdRp n=1 Tax=Hubei reo-like virus 1 TaxID=1923172 RepID=A0A1L3KP10_9VIRU|nr:RdRp [Hubei reo-like virus 1]
MNESVILQEKDLNDLLLCLKVNIDRTLVILTKKLVLEQKNEVQILKQSLIKKLDLTDQKDDKKKQIGSKSEQKNKREKTVKSKVSTKFKGAFKIKQAITYFETLRTLYSDLAKKTSDICYAFNTVFRYQSQIFDDLQPQNYAKLKQPLDDVSYYIRICPDIIIPLSKGILRHTKALDVVGTTKKATFWNPIPPKASDFNYNKLTGICNSPKFRYYANDSALEVKKILDKLTFMKEHRVNDNDPISLSIDDEARRINFRMFTDFANQARFSNLWSQIFSAYLFRDHRKFESYLEHFGNAFQKHQIDNNTTQEDGYRDTYCLKTLTAIAEIMSVFKVLPFYMSDLGRIILPVEMENDFPLSLPWLLSSLLELSVQEKGCSILGAELLEAIKLRVTAAFGSFGTYMLESKSKYSSLVKLSIDCAKSHVRYRYNNTNCTSAAIEKIRNYNEFFLDEEREALLKDRKANASWDVILTNLEKTMGSNCEANSNILRYIITMSGVMGNPGIFYKTSLALEAEASIGAQTHNVINYPDVKTWIKLEDDVYPFDYKWDTGDLMFKEIYRLYYAGLDQIRERLVSVDFEQFFVEVLTNNSQGIKVSLSELGIENAKSGNDQEQTTRLEVFSKLSNSRLAAFVLDHQSYVRFSEWIQRLNSNGLCTIRYQVNRRARIVEIVSNYEQIGYSPLLYVFECLKNIPEWDGISVGKQKGGIIDMTKQLYGSGNDQLLSMFSDIKGMDAATNPPVYKYLSSIFIYYCYKNNILPQKYFALGNETCQLLDENLKPLPETKIQGLIKALLLINGTKNTGKKFELKDGYFTNTMYISTFFFASGQYNTTGQHSVILNCVMKVIDQQFRKIYPNAQFKFDHDVFGDDQHAILQFNDNINKPQYVKTILELSRQLLLQLGFTQEVAISSGYNEYLQLSSLFGAWVPKPDRATIYTNERSEALKRDPIALIKIARNVLASASQRHLVIENVMNLIYGIWIVLRGLILHVDPRQLSSLVFKNVLRPFNTNYMYVIPWITLFMPPLNTHGPPIIVADQIILRRRAHTTIQGDGGWIWLTNSLFSIEDWEELKAVYYNQPEGRWTTLKTGEWIKRPINLLLDKPGINEIILAIQWLTFNRQELVNKTRLKHVRNDISYLSKRVDAYRNSEKIRQSQRASNELLSNYGMRIPNNLAYWYESVERLNQAVQTMDEAANELPISDRKILALITLWTKTISRKVQEYIDKYSIQWSYNDQVEKYSVLSNTHNNKFPLVPGYTKGTGWDALLKMFGAPFGDGGQLIKLTQFSNSGLSNERFDYQLAAKYINQAKKIGDSALRLIRQVFGLRPKDQIELENIAMRNDITNLIYDYSSQFSPSQYFGISGGLKNVETDFFRIRGKYYPKMKNIMRIITRDLIFENSDVFEFQKIEYGYASYTLKYYIIPLRERIAGKYLNLTVTPVNITVPA